MGKIKMILGVIAFCAFAAIGGAGDAMAEDVAIDKLEVSYPAEVGGTVPENATVTAYANEVAQSIEMNVSSDLRDTQSNVISAGSTFEKKGYSLNVLVSLPSGYKFTCEDGDFNGSIVVNGQTIAGSSFCIDPVVIFYTGFEFRDYYDISKLNFDVRYPLATSVASDFEVTQLSSLDGLLIDDYGWYKYGTNCDFSGSLEDAYECWEDNGVEMGEDETFNYGEQYTRVFIVRHPNYYFYNINVDRTLTEFSKGANVNGVPALTGFWLESVVDDEYIIFYNIPTFKDYLTVTFDTQGIGVAPEAQNITPNTTVSEPTVTANGYALEGWYYDEDCTLPVDFNAIITNDVTLYAKWTSVVGVPDTGVETRSLSVTVAGLGACVLTGVTISGISALMIVRRRSK